ncbi:DUF3253 domain-containing protein [Serinibacter arcticus]|uniref:DUF3253 domain-containing protein n=1 Tax=Serinibacter arcticus TaxID=1655435 RepID=A0A4Z1E0K5_9MICO|nr:DUF3253 domain-containing protein [Serinibacter arcticus]TGO04769.1 hypothetical protein SERN_2362 [Serinibacter arcticus]
MSDDGDAQPLERTPDGRYVVIDGRRWRATDPGIPEPLAAELRKALMAARRDVGAATRRGEDPTPVRRRVQAAKVALGERGRPWWEPAQEETDDDERIAETVRAMVDVRSPGTTCPSDVARIVGGEDWRALMPAVRRVAEQLVAEGAVVVTQKGEPVPTPWRGPVRIGLPVRGDAEV